MTSEPKAVHRQVVLPFRKSLEISFQSIRVRFFRSLITTLTLVLAVAFLTFVNVSNDAANGLLAAGDPDLRNALVRAGFDIGPNDVRVDTGPKQRWIVILSMLVCVAGIVNAQLMAVTERFREIGTMKCLGALDRFVMRLFLLEAAMQGMAGALAGAAGGAFFAVLNALAVFGWPALSHFPMGDSMVSVIKSLVAGCALSLLGVIYPAWVAAKMAPVEAMRVEQ